jgi:hypothetical protein
MAFFDQVLVEKITTQARDVHFGRVVLTAVAAVLFGLGWITARAFGVLWLVLVWAAVAVKVGWSEGRKSAPARR